MEGSKMPDVDDRIEHLERETRRLRAGMLVLAAVLAGTILVFVTQATPGELTLRRLAIVDGEGRERIVAGTFPSGEAGVQHYDSDLKLRIATVTLPDGRAAVLHFDSEEKKRISSVTSPDKLVVIGVTDSEGRVVWSKTSE
jgi:hypothetical protein